jgi:hypothetical protein
MKLNICVNENKTSVSKLVGNKILMDDWSIQPNPEKVGFSTTFSVINPI